MVSGVLKYHLIDVQVLIDRIIWVRENLLPSAGPCPGRYATKSVFNSVAEKESEEQTWYSVLQGFCFSLVAFGPESDRFGHVVFVSLLEVVDLGFQFVDLVGSGGSSRDLEIQGSGAFTENGNLLGYGNLVLSQDRYLGGQRSLLLAQKQHLRGH